MTKYKKYVEAVGKLIVKGIWHSDAVEIVNIVLGPQLALSTERFERDVQVYLHDYDVPRPSYMHIFNKEDWRQIDRRFLKEEK